MEFRRANQFRSRNNYGGGCDFWNQCAKKVQDCAIQSQGGPFYPTGRSVGRLGEAETRSSLPVIGPISLAVSRCPITREPWFEPGL
jgi:hypothetical protein